MLITFDETSLRRANSKQHVVQCKAACFLGGDLPQETTNLERYIDIVHEFLGHLIEKEISEAGFQLDSATYHGTRATMHELTLLSGNRIISKEL